jgi:hypothetical protein
VLKSSFKSTCSSKYKETIPLAQLIWDINIGKNELISFKIALNEAAETYGLSPSAAALRVINVVSEVSWNVNCLS